MFKQKNSTNKTLFIVLVISMVTLLLGCKESPKTTNLTYTDETPYALIIEGFEWGPSVTKMVISLNDYVSADTIAPNNFVVKSGDSVRTITDVYLSDKNGIKTSDQTSRSFTIAMTTGFDYSQGVGRPIENSAAFTLSETSRRNVWRDLDIYSLELAEGQSIKISNKSYSSFAVHPQDYIGRILPETEHLKKDSYTYDEITLLTAAYEDDVLANDEGKNPLIIWLHGGGEGGTDVDIALLGNQVTNLWTNQIQKYFTSDDLNGAYVLALQAPTMWMDSGEGMQTGNDSMYTEVLINAIKDYVENNPDIDTNRIYIGGCSNGGYMTMNLLFHEPDFFAAAFPIAEAYSDDAITEEMIQSIKHIPIWFIHSENDTVVKAEDFVIPTYTRLIQAGAENVVFTYYDRVMGQDARYVRYNGHMSWIYPLQDRTALDQNRQDIFEYGTEAITAPSDQPIIIENEVVTLWQWISHQEMIHDKNLTQK